MLEIFVGPERHLGIRKVTSGFGGRFVVGITVKERIHLFAGDLFFVQRTQHQCSRARILELFDSVEIVRERTGSNNQGMRQRNS